jgi:hypothetical protein
VKRSIALGFCLLAVGGCAASLQWHDATTRGRGPDQLDTDMQACARSTGGGATAVNASTTAAWDACMRGFGWAHN